jgi:hypothetical protein
MKYLLLLTLTAVSLLAADATGTWTGTLTPIGDEPHSAHLVLKQDGTKLTGTAGPQPEQQSAIVAGKAEDGKITFEVGAGEATMKFVLRQEGNEIKGDVTREQNGEVQTAKLVVSRSK